MEILSSLQKIGFIQKRSEIDALCTQLFFYMQGLLKNGEEVLDFDRFVLVRALEEVFYPEVITVSGYTVLLPEDDLKTEQLNKAVLYPHHWLAFNSTTKYLIDVLPVDGAFAVSVPQLVVVSRNLRRFVPSATLYPEDWTVIEINNFSKKVRMLASIFEFLSNERPQ
jgi:hypothetical protein